MAAGLPGKLLESLCYFYTSHFGVHLPSLNQLTWITAVSSVEKLDLSARSYTPKKEGLMLWAKNI
jgi:hypothetical protein